MLKLNFTELFIRLIPEVYLIMWFVSILSENQFSKKAYIANTIEIAIFIYLIRLLPIYFGFHMVINIVLFISVIVINGVPLIKAIYSILCAFLILSFSELVNYIFLYLLKIPFMKSDNMFYNYCVTLPSLIIFGLIVILIKYIRNGKKSND